MAKSFNHTISMKTLHNIVPQYHPFHYLVLAPTITLGDVIKKSRRLRLATLVDSSVRIVA